MGSSLLRCHCFQVLSTELGNTCVCTHIHVCTHLYLSKSIKNYQLRAAVHHWDDFTPKGHLTMSGNILVVRTEGEEVLLKSNE